MVTRVSALGAVVTAVLLATASGASAAGSAILAEPGPLDRLSAPVGLTAVGLGLVGMLAGVFRKKKVQPENQRKS
ncbi:hypothetical protein MOQ72_16255 [Saccharopolyspora sp. K220]|uniref:hypothetical protein n=1 Tax=Saccharopolyspora soli TaxID=2926618 RepID=UPI001F57383D|nr:hypothetical protein [Saccharopolyspora soli]MCI2418998.1 hypothetical protein [Saccharopolyspora soli]